jgi:GNAT superfamily N-acetyltransferase
MFPTSSDRTFLFTHPSWESVEPARKMVVAAGGHDELALGFMPSVLPSDSAEPDAVSGSNLQHDESQQDDLPIHRDVTVRMAHLRDWPTLYRLVPAVFPEVDQSALSHLLRNERKAMLVAEVDGQVAGFCHLRVRHQGGVLWINYIGVDQRRRLVGVGQALLQRAQECAAAWGCMRVELDVVVRNAGAVAFYDRSGYRCVTTLVDDQGRVKYRYRREIQLGRVTHRQAPGMPGLGQRVWMRVLYDVWITGSRRAHSWVRQRAGKTDPGEI